MNNQFVYCTVGLCVNTSAVVVSSSSGTDRVDFKFYDLLEQILDKQPSTSSTLVTDSIEISEDSNSESVTEIGKKNKIPSSTRGQRTVTFKRNLCPVLMAKL